MIIMMLQDRNTYFACIGVLYKTYRSTFKRWLYFYSCFYNNKNVIKLWNYSKCWKWHPPASSKKKCPTIRSQHFADWKPVWQMQMIFMQWMWLFSIPYSIVLNTNVSTHVKPCFVCRSKLSNIQTASCEENNVEYKIASQLSANKTVERLRTCTERLGNGWKCLCDGTVVSYVLLSVFTDVCSLVCFL
jgi:hypothetical protein